MTELLFICRSPVHSHTHLVSHSRAGPNLWVLFGTVWRYKVLIFLIQVGIHEVVHL